ncbi:MAG: hypothetical protein ACXWL2_00890 [Candidatus Chromulinivorax sp.]
MIKFSTHTWMYLFLFWTPLFAYFYTYGIPTTIEQAFYAIMYAAIIGSSVLFIFIVTLLVFGLPVPNIFKKIEKDESE